MLSLDLTSCAALEPGKYTFLLRGMKSGKNTSNKVLQKHESLSVLKWLHCYGFYFQPRFQLKRFSFSLILQCFRSLGRPYNNGFDGPHQRKAEEVEERDSKTLYFPDGSTSINMWPNRFTGLPCKRCEFSLLSSRKAIRFLSRFPFDALIKSPSF